MAVKPTLAEINKLLTELIIPFHQIERDMPLPLDGKRNENDSEHSWSLALLASALAERLDPSLDIGKVCIFAIVHDLVEVYAGDVSVWSKADKLTNKATSEEKALKTIEKEYAAFPWIVTAVEAYEQKNSPESLFVYAVDKYLNWFMRTTDNGEYYKNKKITKEIFNAKVAEIRHKAHAHAAVGKLFDELIDSYNSRENFFYQAGA